LDRAGLLVKIADSVSSIDQGRKWLDTEGKAEAGRVSYRTGLALAMEAFKEAETAAVDDLEILFVAEYTFINQELHYCASSDKKTISSLSQAVEDFDDGFLVLKIR
jgi:hypothetical protein